MKLFVSASGEAHLLDLHGSMDLYGSIVDHDAWGDKDVLDSSVAAG
ncbi:hypothetical protein [Streptomyces sp. H27-S2]|nr:hypothetical protein [Streptomyces sp. H27-S2]MCY0953700.1 hypothetical protein [Streptomyces sp. H27-S2]